MSRGLKISMSVFFVIASLMVGCTSKEVKEERTPAQVFEDDDLHSPEQIQGLVDNMVADFQNNKLPVESLVRSTIALAAISQKLSASFDVRIENQLKNPPKDGYVLQSDLDCKIWENYFFEHDAEDTLLLLQADILNSKRNDIYQWFISIFFASRNDSYAQMLTKAQLTRSLADNHADICDPQTCPDFPKVTDPHQRPFDPFDDKEMLAFKNKYLDKIAIYSENDFTSDKPGSCFSSDQREPSQVPAFDWKTHHTSGYSLEPGKFAITYDDGPHAKYTPALAKLWEDSGFTKPSFFWLRINLQRNIPLAKSIRAKGYTIGSHSYDHPDFGNLAKATEASELNRANRDLFAKDLSAPDFSWDDWKSAKLQSEIIDSTKYIYKTLDLDSTVADGEHLFRLPYGSGVKNPLIGRYFAQINVRHYFWTIDSLDWQDKNPASILERVQKQMKISKRGIILFHDIHPQSVKASELLLQAVKSGDMPVPVEFVPLPRKW